MANVVKLHCYIAGKRNTNRAIELLLMIELVNVVSEAVSGTPVTHWTLTG